MSSTRYYKLVEVPQSEIVHGQPFVARYSSLKDEPRQYGKLDWAIHLVEGAAGIYNTQNLIKNAAKLVDKAP